MHGEFMYGSDNLSDKQIDELIRKTYDIIVEDIPKTLKNFVIFVDEESVIEVPSGTGDRVKVIKVLLDYFKDIEEYDKCSKLEKLINLLQSS